MRLTRFIAIILVLNSRVCFCQTATNDSLLLFEELFFNAKSNSSKDSILFKKYNYCLATNLLVDAYKTYLRLERANVKYYNKNYYWNNTLLCTDNNNFALAKKNLDLYRLNFDSISIQSNFLAYLTFINYDSLQAKNYFYKLKTADTSLACLNCFYKLLHQKNKGKPLYATSALVLPGSGLIILGKPVKGLTSMALLGSLAYGVYQLTQYNLYVNALSWTMGLGLKLYSGQVKLTRKEFDKRALKRKNKKAKSCKEAFKVSMTKHFMFYKSN